MARKLSMAHLGCLNWAPPEAVYNAKSIGFDYVSLRIISMGLAGELDYDMRRHPELFRDTRRALEETGIKLHDIEVAKIDDGIDVSKYESAFDAGAELGAVSVITSIWNKNPEDGVKQLETICDLAEKHGLFVGLEYVTWASVWSMAQAAEIVKKLARPNLGILVDTLHAYRSRTTIEQIKACDPKWFEFIHLCGGPLNIPARDDIQTLVYNGRDARYFLTDPENGVPAADYLKVMPENAVLSCELPNTAHSARVGTYEHERMVFETTKEYLKLHGLA